MAQKGYSNAMVSLTMSMFYVGGMVCSPFVVTLINVMPYHKLNFACMALLSASQIPAVLIVDWEMSVAYTAVIWLVRFVMGGCYTCITTNIICSVYKAESDQFKVGKLLYQNSLSVEIGFCSSPIWVALFYSWKSDATNLQIYEFTFLLYALYSLVCLYAPNNKNKSSPSLKDKNKEKKIFGGKGRIEDKTEKEMEKEKENEVSLVSNKLLGIENEYKIMIDENEEIEMERLDEQDRNKKIKDTLKNKDALIDKENLKKNIPLVRREPSNILDHMNKSKNLSTTMRSILHHGPHDQSLSVNSSNSANSMIVYDLSEDHRQITLTEYLLDSRLFVNTICSICDTSFYIFLLQIIVASLMSSPYDLDITQASVYTTIGTMTVVINAFLMYIYKYCVESHYDNKNYAEGGDRREEDKQHDNNMQYQAIMWNNPTTTINNTLAIQHSIINMQENNFIHSINLTIMKHNLSLLHTSISNSNSNSNSNSMQTDLENAKDEQNKNKDLKKMLNIEKMEFEDPFLDRYILLAGRLAFTLGFTLICPTWIFDNLQSFPNLDRSTLMIFMPVGLCCVCLGYCYTYIHMVQEIVQGTRAYVKQRREVGDYIDELHAIDTANAMFQVLWQVGSLTVPLIFSSILDATDFANTMKYLSQLNFVITMLYGVVLFRSVVSRKEENYDKEKGEDERQEKKDRNKNLKEIEIG